jgi:hypothetical protein
VYYSRGEHVTQILGMAPPVRRVDHSATETMAATSISPAPQQNEASAPYAWKSWPRAMGTESRPAVTAMLSKPMICARARAHLSTCSATGALGQLGEWSG